MRKHLLHSFDFRKIQIEGFLGFFWENDESVTVENLPVKGNMTPHSNSNGIIGRIKSFKCNYLYQIYETNCAAFQMSHISRNAFDEKAGNA